MKYDGKHIYIDEDGIVRYKMHGKPVNPDVEEKQPYILPGVYDGLWTAYQLVIIFANENKSEPIKTIDGVRGVNCPVKVIVTDDGSIYTD